MRQWSQLTVQICSGVSLDSGGDRFRVEDRHQEDQTDLEAATEPAARAENAAGKVFPSDPTGWAL